jgi:hypothetical protein
MLGCTPRCWKRRQGLTLQLPELKESGGWAKMSPQKTFSGLSERAVPKRTGTGPNVSVCLSVTLLA